MSQATLVIVRDSGYADRLRAYKILLDGNVIGSVRNGQTTTLQVPAGDHHLQLAVDWCGSEKVAFHAWTGQTKSFQAMSNLRGLNIFSALYYVILARNQYLNLTPLASSDQNRET